ncbi:MAG: universal stress protein, partial [Bdellovibrionia bacterium]
ILMTDDMETETPEGEKRSLAIKTWASALAKRLHRPLKLIHVEDLTLYPVSQPYYRRFIQTCVAERKSRLNKIGRSLTVPSNTALLAGYPAQKLVELTSKKGSYELIVLGSHGRKGAKRLILGSVTEEVIRNSLIPVFTLGPAALESRPTFRKGAAIRILVATDLTENGKSAEEYAMSLAKQLSGEVILFHSLLGGFHPTFQTAFSAGDVSKEYWDLIQQIRPKIIQEMSLKEDKYRQNRIPCENRIDTTSVTASAAILKGIKKQKPDLVIMGTHGRNLLAGAFFGNSARQIILNSPVPVITVRSRV